MASPRFDLQRLARAVDDKRRRQGISLAGLGREVGVAPSTIRRFGTADNAEADGVLAVVRWLGVPPEHFVSGAAVSGRRLPSGEGDAGERFVRVDMQLVAEARGDTGGARGRTRTTIQDLVAAAQSSGAPVAALTRLTEI